MNTLTDYESLTAEQLTEQIVREAAGAPICLTSSFQTEDMVALHMLRRHLPDVPVIFLETGYHFKELLAYRDRMAAEWNLNLINAMPKTTLGEQKSGTTDALAPALRLVVHWTAPRAVAHAGQPQKSGRPQAAYRQDDEE